MRDNYPQIHHLIEKQCEQRSAEVALSFRGSSMTYGELDSQAHKLASQLKRKGVKQGAFVGIAIERSMDAVIAMLGVLKAGCAFVYLDPVHPAAHIKAILEDCKPAHIVEGITGGGENTPIKSDTGREEIAYLLYTSGSTGRPKGVIGAHRSLVARLASSALPDIRCGDICALNNSLSFGISASRVFLPLAIGATLVILPDEDTRNVERFVEAIDESKISSIFMVPALLRQVLRLVENRGKPASLRAVTVSGGMLTNELVKYFFKIMPEVLLMNNYGSSELGTSAASCVYTQIPTVDSVSIGVAAANTIIKICDETGGPVRKGDSGELYVSSPHLARGYLNLPELTREKFPVDTDGRRWYRTGDIGRVLSNGEIQLLGRNDEQCKIRGFRVELGDVEATLAAHVNVDEAAAVVVGNNPDEQQIIAYVSVKPGISKVKSADLREWIKSRLPEYMLPSRIVVLESFPRTHVGKIDRNILASRKYKGPDWPDSCLPQNQVEAALQELCAEALQLQSVGMNENFIEMGGDSLRATQVIIGVRKLYGVGIGLECLFEDSLAVIAARIECAIKVPPVLN